tara:strand:+ start:379 stop:1266 length:888 start_codon:yes stop_codon:yes gene_type:complete
MITLKIFEITFPIFAIVASGYLYARKYNPDITLPNRLNIDVFVPCLIFAVIYEKAGVNGLFGNLALAISIVVLLSGLVAFIVSKIFSIDPRTLCPPLMFGNAGNLGLPLVVLSFGESALTVAVICFVVCKTFHITIGVYLFSRQLNIFNILVSPRILSVFLAIIFSQLNIVIPNAVLEPVRMLGNICIPLMLFGLGIRLIDIKLSEWKIGLAVALLAPICGVTIVLLITPYIELTQLEQGALFLFGALPPAVMNYMFADYYKQEPSKVAAMVLFGNAFSIISIPIALFYALPNFT